MKFSGFLILFLFSILCIGQSDSAISVNNKVWIGKSFAQDQAAIWTSPLRIKKKDLKIVIPILAATVTSIVYDEQIYAEFKRFQNRNKFADDISPIITYMGDDKTSLTVSTLFLAGGAIFKNEKAKRTAYFGYQTFVHSGIVIQVMKHLASRQRPSVDNGKDKWNGPTAMFKRYTEKFSPYDAFPSGHTIVAWGMATVIAKQYSEYKWVPITCYTLATVAGLSRVTEDTHWFSDVIIGGSLGYAIGRFVTKKHQNTKWQLFPSFGKDNTTASLIYTF